MLYIAGLGLSISTPILLKCPEAEPALLYRESSSDTPSSEFRKAGTKYHPALRREASPRRGRNNLGHKKAQESGNRKLLPSSWVFKIPSTLLGYMFRPCKHMPYSIPDEPLIFNYSPFQNNPCLFMHK